MRPLLAGLILALLAPSPGFAETTLIRTGKPLARLYAPAGSETLDDAIAEVNYHLDRMAGCKLEVVRTDDAKAVRKPAIVLGALAVALGAKPERSSPTQEGFRLKIADGLVLVGGESEPGTRNGCYELLRRLGCDWVMPGTIGEVIPKRTTVTLADADTTQTPSFQVRRLWYSGGSRVVNRDEGARFAVWSKRQRANQRQAHPSAVAGHAWDQLIRRNKELFAKNPEMLALRRVADGTLKRSGPQLESTHPGVVQLVVDQIKSTFQKNGWPKDREAGFGIGPADGLGYSRSAESQLAGAGRIDPITGDNDVTDLVIKLANDVLARIGKEYPNVWLGYYVYSTHADFPARYQPHPRISLTFADISYSRFHDFSDLNCRSRAYYRGIVEEWGKLAKKQGNPLYFRGYNWNLAENLVPTTRLKIWGVDLPFYHKQGFRGCNIEAQKLWAINAPHDYLFMRLCWDVTLDWKKVLTEFCQAAYGKAAAPMERYYLRMVERQHGSSQEAGSYHALHLIFGDEKAYLAPARADLDAALKAATTEADRTRVGYARIGFGWLEGYLVFHAALMKGDFTAAKTAYDNLHASWEKAYKLNSDLGSKLTPGYLRRFWSAFINDSVKYSTDPYRIVERLPDEMPTMFDPTGLGHRMRYQGPEVDDRRFLRTKTYSMPWDAQGLGGYRSGAVWYRHHFTLPAGMKGQPIGLFLGGYDDEARVWINGKPVGTSGRGFSRPAAFDLTDGIRYTGDNVLAIQVVRNSAVNELGTGGLFRPSFLFTGPRLKDRAPKPLELRRVLPGGGLGEIEK